MGLKVVSTVVTAAASYDLTTLAIVKDELSITDGSKDASLRRYITSASAAASGYCNRKFQVETIQDEIWPDRDCSPVIGGLDVIQLSRWPIVEVMSLTEHGTALAEDTDYRVDYENGQIVRLSGAATLRWSAWPIVVQYSAGFEAIPSDVEDAVIRMVTKRYSAKGRDATLRQRDIPGVLSESFWIATGEDAGNLTPDIADLLTNYRVPVFAM